MGEGWTAGTFLSEETTCAMARNRAGTEMFKDVRYVGMGKMKATDKGTGVQKTGSLQNGGREGEMMILSPTRLRRKKRTKETMENNLPFWKTAH